MRSQGLSKGRIVGGFFVALFAAVLLAGCSQPTEISDPTNGPTSDKTGPVTQGSAESVTLDCFSAVTISVTFDAGRTYTPDRQVQLMVDQPVRIVLQSDVPTTIDLRGSETYSVVEATTGVSSICTTYRLAGEYPVQVGETIPLLFQVN